VKGFVVASYNHVTIIGTLGQDPQVKYTTGGTAVCEVSLAINRQWFDKATNQKKESVSWVTVVLWGRTAEVAGEYLRKGKSVLIDGRLEESRWDDKDSGQKRSKLKVVCENLVMLGSKQDRAEPRGEESQVPPSEPTFGSDPGPSEEIPF
jgi:single-strand DNA-binding protein